MDQCLPFLVTIQLWARQLVPDLSLFYIFIVIIPQYLSSCAVVKVCVAIMHSTVAGTAIRTGSSSLFHRLAGITPTSMVA